MGGIFDILANKQKTCRSVMVYLLGLRCRLADWRSVMVRLNTVSCSGAAVSLRRYGVRPKGARRTAWTRTALAGTYKHHSVLVRTGESHPNRQPYRQPRSYRYGCRINILCLYNNIAQACM